MNVFYYLLPALLALATKVLHHCFIDSAGFRRKAWIAAGMALLWIAIVLWLAHFFCSYARSVEECFLLWTMAFCVGCIAAVVQVFLLLLCRNRRDVSELEKMMLKDI